MQDESKTPVMIVCGVLITIMVFIGVLSVMTLNKSTRKPSLNSKKYTQIKRSKHTGPKILLPGQLGVRMTPNGEVTANPNKIGLGLGN